MIDDKLDAIGEVFAQLERQGRAYEKADGKTYDPAPYLVKVECISEELLKGSVLERQQGDHLVDAVSKRLDVWRGSASREWAADFLKQVGTKRARTPLVKLLQNGGSVRMHAAAALAQILEPTELRGLSKEECTAVVWGLLAAFNPYAHAVSEIAATARRTLPLLMGPERLVQLVPEVAADPNVLGGLERVLTNIGLPAASPLAGLLDHADHRVRTCGVRCLGKILAEGALVIGRTGGQEPREYAAAALAEVAEVCMNTLREIAKNKQSTVSELATELLSDLTRESVG